MEAQLDADPSGAARAAMDAPEEQQRLGAGEPAAVGPPQQQARGKRLSAARAGKRAASAETASIESLSSEALQEIFRHAIREASTGLHKHEYVR